MTTSTETTSLGIGPAVLFCPANRPDRYEKALQRADTVIFDLEDAVGPEDKDDARRRLAVFLSEHTIDAVVRVNASDTPFFADDLEALRRVGHDLLMLPKASGPEDLRGLEDMRVIALCETAAGVLNSKVLAEHPACRALMWGGEDLIADLGGRRSRNEHGRYHPLIEQARANVLLAATAAGAAAIDAVHIDISDVDGLRRETREAVDLGFDAKACIHPGHVEVIRRAFAVTQEMLAWARGVVEAGAIHNGVFQYEGRMIDEPLIRHARTIVDQTKRQGDLEYDGKNQSEPSQS